MSRLRRSSPLGIELSNRGSSRIPSERLLPDRSTALRDRHGIGDQGQRSACMSRPQRERNHREPYERMQNPKPDRQVKASRKADPPKGGQSSPWQGHEDHRAGADSAPRAAAAWCPHPASPLQSRSCATVDGQMMGTDSRAKAGLSEHSGRQITAVSGATCVRVDRRLVRTGFLRLGLQPGQEAHLLRPSSGGHKQLRSAHAAG